MHGRRGVPDRGHRVCADGWCCDGGRDRLADANKARPARHRRVGRRTVTSAWRGPGGLLALVGVIGVIGIAAAVRPAPAAVAIVSIVLGGARSTRVARRHRDAERNQAVEACAVLAGELRSGRVPAEALTAAAAVATGPSAVALEAAGSAARLGGDVPAALAVGAKASAVPAFLFGLAACWRVCNATGSGIAAAVDRLEQALRAEQEQRRAVDAELAGPRASAALLAVLPAAGVGLAAGLGADPVHVLLYMPLGLVALSVGLGLDLLGLWWTGRLVEAAGGAR